MISSKLRGVEDFLYVLAVAIVMIVIFALISPLVPTGVPSGELTVIEEFTLGTVGFLEEVPAKNILLGDEIIVGRTQSETMRSFNRIEVETSMFGEQGQKYTITVPQWYRDVMERVMIDFRVDSTNMYGNLVLKWNGRIIYQDKAHPRTYHIEVDKSYVESTNSLEIYCEGPGIMFWASTIYRLMDFKVNLEYGPTKIVSFELFQNELNTFNKGEVSFYGTGDARLTIRVNGVAVYDKVPEGSDTAEFQFADVPLNLGDNVVSFSTVGGPVRLFNARLKIYLLTNQITRTRDFEIEAGQYSSLKQVTGKGRIDYNTEGIMRAGSMRIRLNGNDLIVPTPVEGWNTVYFSSEQAQEGSNTLEFSSTGSFDVSTVKIGIERV